MDSNTPDLGASMGLSPPTVGDLLEARFRIRSPLRCEGPGRLDCAEDEQTGTRMAIRWIPLDANGLSAAQSLQGLPQHPTLPRIRSTGELGKTAYVAMEFPEGRLLSSLTPEQLTLELLCNVGADLAEGLAALHAQGVFHGELATDSVLLVGDDRSILWDLPIVLLDRLTERRGGERGLNVLRRKAIFLTPECARGKPATAATDVYALGALLCLASGCPPPSGLTTLSVIHQIAGGSWRPFASEVFPPSHRNLLARMTHRDPFLRPGAADIAGLFRAPDPSHPCMQPLSNEGAAPPWPAAGSQPQAFARKRVIQLTDQVPPPPSRSAEPVASFEVIEAQVLSQSRRTLTAKVALLSVLLAALAGAGLYWALTPQQPSFEAISPPPPVVPPPSAAAPSLPPLEALSVPELAEPASEPATVLIPPVEREQHRESARPIRRRRTNRNGATKRETCVPVLAVPQAPRSSPGLGKGTELKRPSFDGW